MTKGKNQGLFASIIYGNNSKIPMKKRLKKLELEPFISSAKG